MHGSARAVADVLDRVEKLMRLALHNPNQEEARSAALKCLQLMDAHRVIITLHEAPRPAPPPPPISPVRGPSDDALRENKRRADEYVRQARAKQAEEARRAAAARGPVVTPFDFGTYGTEPPPAGPGAGPGEPFDEYMKRRMQERKAEREREQGEAERRSWFRQTFG